MLMSMLRRPWTKKRKEVLVPVPYLSTTSTLSKGRGLIREAL